MDQIEKDESAVRYEGADDEGGGPRLLYLCATPFLADNRLMRPNRILLFKLGITAVVLITAAIWLASGLDLRSFILQTLDALRSAGPFWFFLSMALLPAIGAPMSFFCLAAGSVFGPQLGMPTVLALAIAAIVANMALSWLLASRILHPPLETLLQRLGYAMPHVQSGNMSDLVVLVRVTPGLPFPVQNYLLGLAGVPFARYMLISSLIAVPLNAAIVYFGESLVSGAGRKALLGLLLILALMVAIHMLRRHLRAK